MEPEGITIYCRHRSKIREQMEHDIARFPTDEEVESGISPLAYVFDGPLPVPDGAERYDIKRDRVERFEGGEWRSFTNGTRRRYVSTEQQMARPSDYTT